MTGGWHMLADCSCSPSRYHPLMSSPGSPSTPHICPVCESQKLSKEDPVATLEQSIALMRFTCDLGHSFFMWTNGVSSPLSSS
jgi:hypothetical protein